MLGEQHLCVGLQQRVEPRQVSLTMARPARRGLKQARRRRWIMRTGKDEPIYGSLPGWRK